MQRSREKPAPMHQSGFRPFDPSQVKEESAVLYLSELLIVVYVPFRVVPKPFTAAMIASAMPAAIRPYSIAVAPDSSEKKRLI